MIIDAHSHACPVELIDAVSEIRPGPEVDDLRHRHYLYDWDARVDYMDRIGVDVQVLVPARPPMWLGMSDTDIHDLTRVANDAMGKAVAAYPERFVGIAVLPIVDDVMLAEVGRCKSELGLRGVQVYSNIRGEPVDSRPLWPLYELVSRDGFPVWLHPQHGPTHRWMDRDLVNRLFYWPFETSAAMARLVFGGVLDRFPDLKVVTHHLGGMIPFYGARIESFSNMVGEFAATGLTTSSEPISGVQDRFRRFYADTATSGSAPALRCGLDFFGPDHVVFGTDFPFEGEEIPRVILHSIEEAELASSDRADILGNTARRLLSL